MFSMVAGIMVCVSLTELLPLAIQQDSETKVNCWTDVRCIAGGIWPSGHLGWDQRSVGRVGGGGEGGEKKGGESMVIVCRSRQQQRDAASLPGSLDVTLKCENSAAHTIPGPAPWLDPPALAAHCMRPLGCPLQVVYKTLVLGMMIMAASLLLFQV